MVSPAVQRRVEPVVEEPERAPSLTQLEKNVYEAPEEPKEPEVVNKNIAIVGTCSSSWHFAPFKETETWEVWCCAPGSMGSVPRNPDIFFEMHPYDRWAKHGSYLEYCVWLRTLPKVFFLHEHPQFPNGEAFPRDAVMKAFGPYGWTSTLAYMMAYAMLRQPQPKVIGIYGADMTAPEEYDMQRPGMQNLIQRAWERGIDIIVPPESDLLEPAPMYGYCEESRMWRKCAIKKQELQQEQEANLNSVKELLARNHAIAGELDVLKWLDITFVRELESKV